MIEHNDFTWYVGIGLKNLFLSPINQGLKITYTHNDLEGAVFLDASDVKNLQESLKNPMRDGIMGDGYVITYKDFTFQFSDPEIGIELIEEDFRGFVDFVLNIQ